MFAIALALGCSACYGVSNFIGPQLASKHTLVSVLILSQAAALGACLLYLLASPNGRTLPAGDVWLAGLAGAGNAGGLIGFYKAAERAPLAVVAPIGALGTIIPVFWGLTLDPPPSDQTMNVPSFLIIKRRTPSGSTVERRPEYRTSQRATIKRMPAN